MAIIGSMLRLLQRPLADKKAVSNAFEAMSPAARQAAWSAQMTSSRLDDDFTVSYSEIVTRRTAKVARSRANHPTSQPKTH